jgi:2-polyprenyl-6-methoxyphenol hydroxylase-like FAD-dependent oxidoreductase
MSNKTGTNGRLRVGIVGGSITGCAAAIELSRAGHDVTILERSRGELKGRGAGIGIPVAVRQTLVERDLIDTDMPYFHVERIPHVGRAPAAEPYGRTPWVIPVPLELLNWGDLYRNLRRRVPDACYRQGQQVTSIQSVDDEGAVLGLSDGQELDFDLVICADGYDSLGRKSLFPEAKLQYRGYVLWRGVMEEKDLADCGPLEAQLQRVGYDEAHGVFYFVPGVNGSVAKGERWVNWALYVRVPQEELTGFLTDKDGKPHEGSLAPGMMPLEQEASLKRLARDRLPSYYADIIRNSQDTFAQAIYIVSLPGYHKGRVCLAGDAGSVAPPFTASGVFKGMNNAIDLTKALQSHDDVDAALAAWDAQETATGNRMAALGEQLERALIWSIPDFSHMDEAGMRAWWENAAKMPEDVFGTAE